MKNTSTKSRKMLVKLVDGNGNVFTRIFPIELPTDFNQSNFNVDKIEIAEEFHKPYSGAISKLAQNLVTSQINELEKIKILADSSLDTEIKIKFVSDYNLATTNRLNAFNNLYPKAKAYRAEKGLRDITLAKFHSDFSPIDDKTKQKFNSFRYVTLSKDQKEYSLKAVDLIDQSETATDK